MQDYIYDTETYPNCCLVTLMLADPHAPFVWTYEISDWRDDRVQILEFCHRLATSGDRMVGFNNVGFDYPVLHHLLTGQARTAADLYAKAMAIITSQSDEEGNRWAHQVRPSDRMVPQIDLFKIHHFDNKARSTSLKALQFVMRSESVEDLPIPVGTVLTREQVEVLKDYNLHDVQQTRTFYHHTADMLRFREELTTQYQRDFLNHNDTKIGKDFFVMRLEQQGVRCYDVGPEGRTPRQTVRSTLALRDAILPWIAFQSPELNRVLEYLKQQTIVETKGVFKDLSATVDGFEFVFGTGGIHGSVESQVVTADDDHIVVDLDVSSYYPNLAVKNKFYPAHLGPQFCDVYLDLYERRKKTSKGSAENAMLKLALNGVYGDSNNKFSPFYDPLFTMSITLNGQLLICLLAENVMRVPGARLIQVNTDGLTVRLPRTSKHLLDQVCEWWQQVTKLTLEEATYARMFVRDVNNYLACYTTGGVKRKGAYEYKRGWHQDHSALVVPKVAEKALLEGAGIRESVEQWPHLNDFLKCVKAIGKSYLVLDTDGRIEPLSRTVRYCVTKTGGYLFKMMPPLKGKTEWRKIAVESGWKVTVCNRIERVTRDDVDPAHYVNECEKLVLGIV